MAGAVCGDQLVVGVLHVGHVEGWVASVHDEEDDAEGEEVDHLGLVGLLGVDLGRHEAQRAHDAPVDARPVAPLHGAREPEVHNLHVVELIKEDVLAFKVAMSETTRVDVVDRLDELLCVVAADFLTERARVRYVVKKLTARDQLADNVGYLDLLTVLFGPNRALVKLEVLKNMFVVKHVDRLNFVAQQLESPRVELWVV